VRRRRRRGGGGGAGWAVVEAGGGAIVEAAARCGARWWRGRFVVGLGVEVVELADEVAGFGELGEIDLAAADEIEDEGAQVGEGVVAAAVGAGVVEAGAAFASAALEGVADDAGGGPEQCAESAA
jgi:hypothetical protein